MRPGTGTSLRLSWDRRQARPWQRPRCGTVDQVRQGDAACEMTLIGMPPCAARSVPMLGDRGDEPPWAALVHRGLGVKRWFPIRCAPHGQGVGSGPGARPATQPSGAGIREPALDERSPGQAERLLAAIGRDNAVWPRISATRNSRTRWRQSLARIYWAVSSQVHWARTSRRSAGVGASPDGRSMQGRRRRQLTMPPAPEGLVRLFHGSAGTTPRPNPLFMAVLSDARNRVGHASENRQ